MFSQHQVGGEIVSSPSVEQGGNGRAELVEKITELTALLHVQPSISHEAEVYGVQTGSGRNDDGILASPRQRSDAQARDTVRRSAAALPMHAQAAWNEVGGFQLSRSHGVHKEASMSFVTTHPEALAYAAGKLEILGSAMEAESAAAAGPTTSLVPAASDEVSALQAAIFAAYGGLYQSVSAQATANHELFVHTLGTSARSYTATESANSAATASPGGISGLSSSAVKAAAADPPGDALANIVDIGTGNWSSASSDLLGMCGGGLLVKSGQGLVPEGGTVPVVTETVPTGAVGPAGFAGSGGVPMFAGLGQVASVGRLSVPPSWAAGAVPAAASPGAVTTAGWTAPAPQSAPATTMPAAMPSMATAGKAAGYGAPRYGVKPTVMGRPTVV